MARVGERAPLRDGVRGLGDGIRVAQIGLLHRTRQDHAGAARLGAGEHQVDRRHQVRAQHRQHELEVTGAADLAGEMDDNVRAHAAHEVASGDLVGEIAALPAHLAVVVVGPA